MSLTPLEVERENRILSENQRHIAVLQNHHLLLALKGMVTMHELMIKNKPWGFFL